MTDTLSVSATGIGVHAAVPVTISGTLSGNIITATRITVTEVSLSGILDDALYVGGKLVKLLEPVPTLPVNFRIYDTFPTDNPEETNSMMWLKWNYDGLDGTKATPTGSGINVAEATFTGET